MNAEPPETAHRQGEELPVEQDPSEHGSPGRWRTVAAVVGVLVVAGGVAAFLFLSSDPEPPSEEATPPTEGLACAHLVRAAEAYEEDDQTEFDREIARAGQVAEDTLQNSGEAFGEPERIALELGLGQDEDVEQLLVSAQAVCSALVEPRSG